MSDHPNWARVSQRYPCPICGKPDWCLRAADGSAAICPRVAEGSKGSIGEAGYLHILRREDPSGQRPRRRSTRSWTVRVDPATVPGPDLAGLAARYQAAVRPEALARLARSLGVSAKSLRSLGIGWHGWAWSFPMTDASGRVLGIRLRNDRGEKWSVAGGHEGLFVPTNGDGAQPGSTLLVCEGPTDTAALLDLGFAAVGRPSALGGLRLLVGLVRARRAGSVLIVSDSDEVGRRGAETLTQTLVAYVPEVRVIRPPEGVKDVRAWKNVCATADDLQRAIEAARVRRLGVRVVVNNRRSK